MGLSRGSTPGNQPAAASTYDEVVRRLVSCW